MAAHVHTSPVLLRERAESARFSLRSWRQQSRADGARDAHTQQVHDHLNCEEGKGAARERQVSYCGRHQSAAASVRVCATRRRGFRVLVAPACAGSTPILCSTRGSAAPRRTEVKTMTRSCQIWVWREKKSGDERAQGRANSRRDSGDGTATQGGWKVTRLLPRWRWR